MELKRVGNSAAKNECPECNRDFLYKRTLADHIEKCHKKMEKWKIVTYETIKNIAVIEAADFSDACDKLKGTIEAGRGQSYEVNNKISISECVCLSNLENKLRGPKTC
jgi:ribosomal protein L37AE/L43A